MWCHSLRRRNAFMAILGDCDHVTMATTQYLKCPTREERTLDFLYANAKDAYSCSPLPPLRRSNHNLVHLKPCYVPCENNTWVTQGEWLNKLMWKASCENGRWWQRRRCWLSYGRSLTASHTHFMMCWSGIWVLSMRDLSHPNDWFAMMVVEQQRQQLLYSLLFVIIERPHTCSNYMLCYLNTSQNFNPHWNKVPC